MKEWLKDQYVLFNLMLPMTRQTNWFIGYPKQKKQKRKKEDHARKPYIVSLNFHRLFHRKFVEAKLFFTQNLIIFF